MYLKTRVKLFPFTFFPVIYMYPNVKIICSSISEKLNSTKKSPTWLTFQLLRSFVFSFQKNLIQLKKVSNLVHFSIVKVIRISISEKLNSTKKSPT